MAQINMNEIERIDKTRNAVHEKAYATYTIFEMDNTKYFQLDTYGKKDRKIPEKISQSIQLDRDSARILVDFLKQEFDL